MLRNSLSYVTGPDTVTETEFKLYQNPRKTGIGIGPGIGLVGKKVMQHTLKALRCGYKQS